FALVHRQFIFPSLFIPPVWLSYICALSGTRSIGLPPCIFALIKVPARQPTASSAIRSGETRKGRLVAQSRHSVLPARRSASDPRPTRLARSTQRLALRRRPKRRLAYQATCVAAL